MYLCAVCDGYTCACSVEKIAFFARKLLTSEESISGTAIIRLRKHICVFLDDRSVQNVCKQFETCSGRVDTVHLRTISSFTNIDFGLHIHLCIVISSAKLLQRQWPTETSYSPTRAHIRIERGCQSSG